MNKFYEDSISITSKYLLQATPYVNNPRYNFDKNLTKECFFDFLYCKRSNSNEFSAENDLFDNRILHAVKDLYNKFGKVSLIHIAGYAGCGKTTYIHRLLWEMKDEIGLYDVIDYESCKRASEPFIYRVARILCKQFDVFDVIEYFEKIVSLSLYNVNRFRDQIPVLKEFSEKLGEHVVNTENNTIDAYRILLSKFEDEFIKRGKELGEDRKAKKDFVSFMLFLDFILLLFDRFSNTKNSAMLLVIDNADSLEDLSEEMLLLESLREFDNDCNYFFGWNLDNDMIFSNRKVSDVLKRTKLSILFTTRIATINKYESLEPDWESIDGWESIRFPSHYYDHKDIINHRIDYYLGIEDSGTELFQELNLIKKLTEIAYYNYNFMRLFNGNYRVCVDKICSIINMTQRKQIEELIQLYSERRYNSDAIEGSNGYFLSLVLGVLKNDEVYSSVLNLSPCRKDGTISLSRIILTILREKGDRCSLMDMFELLTPIGYSAVKICTQVWQLSETSRQKGWRRLLVFDVNVPSNPEELKKQADSYNNGNRNVEDYTELVTCTAGQAYMEFVIPHFEFMLSRHELGVGTSARSRYQPLFSPNSRQTFIDNFGKRLYRFEKKIEWIYKDVENCCYNSVTFADAVQKQFHLTRGEYINSTYYNYHSVGWDHDVGSKQSYESRLIFRHVGYIEKYRCYLLNSIKESVSIEERIDINKRLVQWIVKYLKLYENSYICYQTDLQNKAADELQMLAKRIIDSQYEDFVTRIETN